MNFGVFLIEFLNKEITLISLVALTFPLAIFSETINLDKGNNIVIHLKNNATNLIKFPFVIQKANLTTASPDDFTVSSKNYSVIVVPTAEYPSSESGDLLVWSAEGDPYLIKIKPDGKNGEQIFEMGSNKVQNQVSQKAARFETGMIESDIKNITKALILNEEVPGYKKVDIKKKFFTPDLEMQKDYFYDGGKYRAEVWYIKNRTNDTLYLDYENFYTPGILGISFEKKTIKPGQISKAWIIIDKHTIYQNKRG